MKHYHLLALLMLVLVAPVLAADPLTHVVQKGETLYGISRQYGLPVDAIMTANNIKDASRVRTGTRLLIPGRQTSISAQPTGSTQAAGTTQATGSDQPGSTTYTVQKGDTLYGISRKFGTSADSIQKANGLAGTTIQPGQTLAIPGTSGVAGADTSAGATGTGTTGAGTTGTGASVSATGTASTAAKNPAPGNASKPATTSVPSTIVTVKTPAWPVSGTVSYLQGKLKGAAITGQPGSSLIAVRAGTVISAGPFRGFGRVAFVQAADGLVYVYGGATSLNVRVGDSVRRGAVVGSLDAEEDGIAYF
ncbi:MAG: LysM peptidoglycan-binding domain-containing protein, partial [Spirochaetia bacterium]|nr:LysM peptidoglycan-binding domain-containing protein [Spirochaetia bacterium]